MNLVSRAIACIDAVLDLTGAVASAILIALAGVLAYNVVARYAFSASSIALEELAWHFYSAIFLLGLSYALKAGAHVRVDLIFEGLSARTRAYIDLGGCLVFLLPLCAVVVVSGWHFTLDSWGFGERPDGVFALLQQALDTGIGEKSQDPGGLNNRWFIKGVIPLSFALLFLAGIAHALRQIQILRGLSPAVESEVGR